MAAGIGLAALGAGGVAVFITQVEAGPVALLAIGGAFLFLAIGGYMPTRLKIGDNEAEWQAVQGFIQATVDDVAPDDRPEVLRRVSDLAKSAPQIAAPALTAMAYEQMVAEMIREIAHDVRPNLKTSADVSAGRRFDMVLVGPTNRLAVVEIKSRAASNRSLYEQIYNRYAAHKDELKADSFLLITSAPVTVNMVSSLQHYKDLILVQVSGYKDMPALRKAIERAVGPFND